MKLQWENGFLWFWTKLNICPYINTETFGLCSCSWLHHPFQPQVGTYFFFRMSSAPQVAERSLPWNPGEGLVLLQDSGEDTRGGWNSFPLSQMAVQGGICAVERGERSVKYFPTSKELRCIHFKHLLCHGGYAKAKNDSFLIMFVWNII